MSEEPIPEEIQEPIDQQPQQKDLLTAEIDQEAGSIILEATRYTTLNRMIDEFLVEFHTQLSKQAIDIIMFKKNWINAYKLTFQSAMKKSPSFNINTLSFLNAHQEEITNYMKLQVSKDGWRAKQFFKTLQGDEKEAKKWGFSINSREPDRTSMDD